MAEGLVPVLVGLADPADPESQTGSKEDSELAKSGIDWAGFGLVPQAKARQALAALEDQYEREKDALERQLRAATEEASTVRDGLLYGSGAELVSAVQAVLTAAGFEVTDLDAELGDTTSADLLAVLDGNRCLIEVKSVSGGASENLAAALHRHISTWPGIQPTQKPFTCSALIVNHQYRLPPRDRPAQVYTRREFVASLPFPVIPTTRLFDWWRASDWPSITNALLASAPPARSRKGHTPRPQQRRRVGPSGSGDQVPENPQFGACRRWRWKRQRTCSRSAANLPLTWRFT